MSVLETQRGSLFITTLITLSALGLLAASGLQAALLQQRMVKYHVVHTEALVAAETLLAQVERQLQQAVLHEDEEWLDSAAAQMQALENSTFTGRFRISRCCDTPWDPQLPLEADNVAQLFDLHVEVQGLGLTRLALWSRYVILPGSEAQPLRARRIAWRQEGATF